MREREPPRRPRIRPPLVGVQIHAVLRPGLHALARQRTPVPGAPATIATCQPADAVDDPLPGKAVSTGVRNPSHLACGPRPAGQARNLPVGHDAPLGHCPDERVDAIDKRVPPAHFWLRLAYSPG